ncbi:MAG: hypothetical protein ACI841_001822 [Planctomycetota bacterium]|jgi:hypothetical protein
MLPENNIMRRARKGHFLKWWLDAPMRDEHEKSIADDAKLRADRHSVDPTEETEAGVRWIRGADASSY